MEKTKGSPLFQPAVPGNAEHAPLIRQEALDWLETHFSEMRTFSASNVLQMAGEQSRRWLMTRIRAQGIGQSDEMPPTEAADALTVLFLRSRGIKFADAIDAVASAQAAFPSIGQSFGGIWNRLMLVSLERMQRLVPPRVLGAAIASLLGVENGPPNALVIVRPLNAAPSSSAASAADVTPERAYQSVLERPLPVIAVISPSGELVLFGEGQSPAISEFRSRTFVRFQITAATGGYDLFVGTTAPLTNEAIDRVAMELAGQALDLVFVQMSAFEGHIKELRFDAPAEPELHTQENLDLWLMSQLVSFIYPGALVEVMEVAGPQQDVRVLASSSGNPWDLAPWEAPSANQMLSGYSSLIGVPLVMDKITEPLAAVVKNVASEIQYLNGQTSAPRSADSFAAAALPIYVGYGAPFGSLYVLAPRSSITRPDADMRLLAVLARVTGEVIQRRQATYLSTTECASIATTRVLDESEFHVALARLLEEKAADLGSDDSLAADLRLPILVVSAETPDPGQADPKVIKPLESWLGSTLDHLAWRPFLRSHLTVDADLAESQCVVGKVSDRGVVIAFNRLVSKDELIRIRNAFPATVNAISPSNSPVKLVAWIVDIPAHNLVDAAAGAGLDVMAEQIQRWAVEVSSVVDDIAQSFVLALGQGDWSAALKRLRRGIRKAEGQRDTYLHRRAADCCFALGDWPSALRYAQEAGRAGANEMGSGRVRSLCQEADANLCLGRPLAAWDCYAAAIEASPSHPLPTYYRGQGLLLMARLVRAYEQDRSITLSAEDQLRINDIAGVLADCAILDLTQASDVFDRGSFTPEMSLVQNFNLVPSLIGQGTGYLLSGLPGPAASRFQSARRAFPKDDLIFREFLFARCWEQGVHRTYGQAFLGDAWEELQAHLEATFALTSG